MKDKLASERYSVQKPIIEYVCEESTEYTSSDNRKIFVNLGWKYVSKDEALKLRGGNTGLVFKEIFINQLKNLNSFVNDNIAMELIRQIERIPPNIQGNFIAWEYLKGLRTVFVPDEKRERNVHFIDTENIDNNIFQVTDEFEFTNGTKTIRLDIVFLINGLPVLFIETKAAHKIEGMSEALEQVRRYHRECPELLDILQVYAISHLIKYYYSATWNTSIKSLFNWKEEVKENLSTSSFEILVKTFFDKNKVIKLITDFILFTRQDEELQKVVLRPHQIRAVDKIIDRSKNKLKRRGLIWHTQGSGKTYTMIVTAQKIIENPIFQNPTVIMLVDRNELESQLFGNLRSVGIENMEVAESKKHLQELLRSDRRGLIVTMIHKFEGMPANINTRENIFVLVDEAHRTTTGDLGNYMMGALPNATYIGFSGTPIDKTKYGEGTFVTFGRDDPPKGYLDKYSIVESIEDGTTVPLHYTLAPNELRVDRKTLEEEFFKLAETEGISDIDTLNKVLDKAVTLKNMLKNKERIEKVAKYVVEHYKEFVEPMGYKAFLVAVDREACTLYKNELDKYLPTQYSQVVYSRYYNDPDELIRFYLTEEEEKRIRMVFKKPDGLPKILIVTEKLLTGFDAPILYCMYLDKPMRDHVLLQAIARVNRPYEDYEGRKKTCGFVLDFVGIFDNLEKALSFDSSDIEGIVKDIAVLKEEFAHKMRFARNEYLTLIKDKSKDKAIETILEFFRDEEERHKYYQFFKQLKDIYEILSPDSFLRDYIDDFDTLSRIYRILKETYDYGVPVDKEFTRKTAQLVQKHTSTDKIDPTLEIYAIDENTLKKLEEKKASDTQKIFNILISIKKTIENEMIKSPYLISIGEKAEIIVELYKNRQKTTQETLEELKKIIEEMNHAKKQQKEKNMSPEEFTIYRILGDERIENPEAIAKHMIKVLTKYPHWYKSEKHEREVKKVFYDILLKSSLTDTQRVTKIVQEIMRLLKSVHSI